jgi:hypothetical protein
MDYKSMNRYDIINWCKENNQVEWLKKEAAKKISGRKITFFELKLNFAKKFMPEILPKAKTKALTFYEEIEAL